MKRLNVYLIDKQYEDLVKITKEDGIKLLELARRAIDEYLVRRKRKSR